MTNYLRRTISQCNTMPKTNPKLVNACQYKLPFVPECRHKLDVIQSYCDPHPDVINAYTEINYANTMKLHEYPYATETYFHLKDAVAEYCGVNASNITFTAGSDMALKVCLEAFATVDAAVCVPVPTYPHFESFLDTMTVRDIRKPHITSVQEMVEYDFNGVDLAYIVSPNIPLGYTLTSEEIYSLTTKWPDTMFIVDGAYIEFQCGGLSSATTGNKVTNIPNLILVRTFSKAFGLAGLRIGYFIASEQNVQLMSPLVNDKNVTSIAIACADACMRNLTWYRDQVVDIQLQKKSLARRLEELTSLPGSLINGYSIKDANFFLIYSSDTARVCEIFARHGIMILDKSADFPNAIRICMGPITIMREVLRIVEYCNLEQLLREKTVAYDLDLTLRSGPSVDYPPYPGVVETLNARHAQNPFWIVSNTCEHPDQVRDYLQLYGVKVGCNIITGYSMILDEIARFKLQSPCIFDTKNGQSFEGNDCIVILTPDVSMNDLVSIARSGLPVFTIRDSKMSSAQNSYVWSSANDTRCVPELGLIADILRKMGVTVIRVDKVTIPDFPTNIHYMFGDSDSDREFAKRFNATFYEVGRDNDAVRMQVETVNLN